MANKRALNFRCAESVTSHIQNIINAADDPSITVFIATRAVAREVIALKFAPVLFSVARIVAVDRAQHRRPRPANNQFAADIRADFLPLRVDYGWIYAKERKRGASGLGWCRPGKRSDHNRASLGLQPRIDDGTTTTANCFVIPNPSFRIDRFAHCA